MAATHYAWDPEFDCITRETDGAGNVIAEYTVEPRLHGQVISQHRNCVSSIYHYDAMGNTRALTDSNQNVTDTAVYTAFGEKVASTGTTVNPFGYKGALGYYTNQGADYVEVKENIYSPSVARLLSKSTLLEKLGTGEYLLAIDTDVFAVPFQDGPGKTSRIPSFSCAAIEAAIRSMLNTDAGRKSWDHYVGVTGTPVVLTSAEMNEILSIAPNFNKELDAATEFCEKAWKHADQFPPPRYGTISTPGDNLPAPWDEAIGGVSIKLEVVCDCHCLYYKASISDLWDFDPKWFNTHRSAKGELKTILVYAAGMVGRCGWKAFNHTGEFCDKAGAARHSRHDKNSPLKCK